MHGHHPVVLCSQFAYPPRSLLRFFQCRWFPYSFPFCQTSAVKRQNFWFPGPKMSYESVEKIRQSPRSLDCLCHPRSFRVGHGDTPWGTRCIFCEYYGWVKFWAREINVLVEDNRNDGGKMTRLQGNVAELRKDNIIMDFLFLKSFLQKNRLHKVSTDRYINVSKYKKG